jgi:hypothetical protein
MSVTRAAHRMKGELKLSKDARFARPRTVQQFGKLVHFCRIMSVESRGRRCWSADCWSSRSHPPGWWSGRHQRANCPRYNLGITRVRFGLSLVSRYSTVLRHVSLTLAEVEHIPVGLEMTLRFDASTSRFQAAKSRFKHTPPPPPGFNDDGVGQVMWQRDIRGAGYSCCCRGYLPRDARHCWSYSLFVLSDLQ